MTVDSMCPDADELVGQAVDEYFELRDRGEELGLAEFIERFPSIADILRSVIPALELATAGSSDEASFQAPLQSIQFGDFRIWRQLGRGGMGIVYEAEQISMGRRVALKVLPIAGLVDPVRIQRFGNEVRAVAALEHPHIVPIYLVGEERGVHYYAMRLIRGRSLGQVIDALRRMRNGDAADGTTPTTYVGDAAHGIESPPAETVADAADSTLPCTTRREFYHSVAALGIQAADALHHAHERGVIHRDVKPGNLLLDDAANLFVTDFGLARVVADAGVTMSGDLVGTLRYMAPEQILGKPAAVDGRTDVYSLGATLYELLALTPMFPADDRHTLIHRITLADPPPLRQLDASIPTDLETIVSKAVAKDPADRYLAMEALAADLRAFVENRPIEAKAPTYFDRFYKWTKRHRGVAAAALSACGIGLLSLLVSTVVVSGAWLEQRQAAQQMLVQRDEARYGHYVADMRLASYELDRGNLAAVASSLAAHGAASPVPEQRGWEWYFLNARRHEDVRTIDAHKTAAYCVAWSPDGSKLASGGHDAIVRIWEADTGHELLTLRGHNQLVSGVAWSPDGNRIATTSQDESAIVWDVESGSIVHRFVLKGGAPLPVWSVRAPLWNRDGTRLAATSSDDQGASIVYVWDAASGEELRTLKYQSVYSLAWSPDSSQLAAAGGAIRVWDVESGEVVKEIVDERFELINAITWNPDGSRLAICDWNQRLMIWDTKAWGDPQVIEAHQGKIRSLSWDPTGKLLASGGEDTAIILWDPETAEAKRILLGHQAGVISLSWRADGQRLASAGLDGMIKVWEPQSGQAVRQMNARGPIAFSPDSMQIAAIEERAAKATGQAPISIYDARTLRALKSIPVLGDAKEPSSAIAGLAWNRDGTRMAAGFRSGKLTGVLKVWDVATNREIRSIAAHESSIEGLAWDPAGKALATTGDTVIRVWDAATGEKTAELDVNQDSVRSVAFSPDGARMASAGWRQSVKVWDTTSWQELLHLNRDPTGAAWGADGESVLAWRPKSDRLAAGGANGWVIVWDAASGRELLSFRAHAGNVRTVAWSPDGRRLASGGEDGHVKIWDAETGALMLSLDGHKHIVYSLHWSTDGKQLLSSGEEVILWDATRGYERN